jgi:hypothetical protein
VLWHISDACVISVSLKRFMNVVYGNSADIFELVYVLVFKKTDLILSELHSYKAVIINSDYSALTSIQNANFYLMLLNSSVTDVTYNCICAIVQITFTHCFLIVLKSVHRSDSHCHVIILIKWMTCHHWF